jgi:hypothetical protein
MMADVPADKLRELAAKAVSCYMRRVRYLDRGELEQVAAVAMLEAARYYDPARNNSLGAYLWPVALSSIGKAMRKASAPVSAGKRLDALAETVAVPTDEALRTHSHPAPMPDTALDVAELAHRVRARLAELIGKDGIPFALSTFTGEWSPSETAAYHGLDVRDVYRMRQAVRLRVLADAELYALWKERVR